MLNLVIGRRALVLPQSDVPDFVNSPWEPLSSLRVGWEDRWGKVWEEAGGEGVITWIGMQNKKKIV